MVISADPRCYPLIELSDEQIRAMLRPVTGGAEPEEVSRVEGGLVNTVYRIVAGRAIYGLRVYAADDSAFEMECRLLRSLVNLLPVPEPLFADASGRRSAHPYLIYKWIEGISLNEWRRQISLGAFTTLAEPLGRLSAQIARVNSPANYAAKRIQVAEMLGRTGERLSAGPARQRIGRLLAHRLYNCLNRSADAFQALDNSSAFVHGDFGGRNILVKADERGEWQISGVIDWEYAAVGSALWDVGSLFRYSKRYSEEFRTLFARGYHAAGGNLPADWWLLSRAIDAMRLVAILNEERELPTVFAECAELIASVVAALDASASPADKA